MKQLSWKVVGLSLGSFLSITYVFCVVWDLFLPKYEMHSAWAPYFPGFQWLSVTSFFIGLIEAFLYGVYTAVVFVPIYNFFSRKMEQKE